jgi:hypothetical protein
MNRKLSAGRKTGFLLSALLLCLLIYGTLLFCEYLKDKPLLSDLCTTEGYQLYVEGQLVGAALTDLISPEGIPVNLLDQVRPYVTVATVELAVAQESLPFGITYEKTFDLPQGEDQVKENGVPGLQEDCREIMKMNLPF